MGTSLSLIGHLSSTLLFWPMNISYQVINWRQMGAGVGVEGGGHWSFQISQGESVLESQLGPRTSDSQEVGSLAPPFSSEHPRPP